MGLDTFFAEEDEAAKILRDHWVSIDDYIVNDDGSIDVIGNVKFSKTSSFLTEIPLIFNKVSGDFDCSNLNLKSLKNSPIEVGGTFDCTYNQLSTLEYLPKKAKGFIFDNTVKSIFTGGINSNFEKVLMMFRTNDPKLIGLQKIITDNAIYLPTIFKYQNYYEVWNNDKSFNEQKFNELIDDIKDGLE
ncbi:hypothetical protein E0I26_04080 [Flavobacterium rhamnosiphilum]|uniref:Uncharacterized protein n=1 Tax=Flavobacterium rhamnosiphilum TaxID=2541724 RepID=A0A4R5FBR9_9FLAO|nr:hypothetical protein [Flavobacterium rhamnosiphilum]TDE45874.1 hypothetical protein E0I26_04080 [Flavobacterium rhamnosiphilum]